MYIHVYENNPTAGGTDGTLVSEGTSATPITISLDATSNQVSAPIKLAVRCDSGFQANSGVTISLVGTTAAKWAMAPDSGGVAGIFGAYGAPLTISSVIGTTNVIFWAEAKATSDEIPQNDISVKFQGQAQISAV